MNAKQVEAPAVVTKQFDDLDLSPIMRRALQKAGFEEPSPIQAELIPYALDGLDVIGQARTGTGKTAAFSIPILEQLDSLEELSLIHISEPTRLGMLSRMPSSA